MGDGGNTYLEPKAGRLSRGRKGAYDRPLKTQFFPAGNLPSRLIRLALHACGRGRGQTATQIFRLYIYTFQYICSYGLLELLPIFVDLKSRCS